MRADEIEAIRELVNRVRKHVNDRGCSKAAVLSAAKDVESILEQYEMQELDDLVAGPATKALLSLGAFAKERRELAARRKKP